MGDPETADIVTPDEVLDFWFGGDLEVNYKTKWFPAGDKDGSAQKAADTEITMRFGKTLGAATSGALQAWADGTPETAVALVVVLDQFSRHVYRNAVDREAKLSVTDAIAVAVTNSALKKQWHKKLTPAMHVFLLMPFRHTQMSVVRLQHAIDTLSTRLTTHIAEQELLEKFRRTTLRVLQDLRGKGFVDGDEILEHHEFTPETRVLRSMPNHVVYQTVFKFLKKILLGAEDETQMERRRPRAKKDRIAVSGNWDARNNAHPDEKTETNADDVQSEPETQPPVVPSVGISLSGGVDSMVLALILKQISCMGSHSPFGEFKVVAMHVDYANRPESQAEATFVEQWCARMGIQSVTKRIDFMKRGVTPREEYEVISRAARYDLYKNCRAIHHFPGVFVGHHVGDVQENVIANIFRGAHLLSVNGMKETGVVEGVAIYRPMLSNDKTQILDFAHIFGVPYFLDTTPAWSTRGKLRNQLQPLLAEMFGDGYLHNLTTLGQDSEQLELLFEDIAMRPFIERLVISDLGAYVDLDGFQSQPMLFWKEAMKRICHGLGTGAMTEKSVRELIDRITVHRKRHQLKDGWITLKKTNKTFVQGTTLGMFSSEVFPQWSVNAERVSSDPNKKKKKQTVDSTKKESALTTHTTPHKPPPFGFGHLVALGTSIGVWGVPTEVGPWTIEAREVANVIGTDESVGEIDDGTERKTLLSSAAQIDVFSILHNEINYYLPYQSKGLCVRYGARLPPFRGIDTAVTKVLPFAVCEVEGLPNDPRDLVDEALAENFAEEYKVKKWPLNVVHDETCVEVRMRFTRTKTRSAEE